MSSAAQPSNEAFPIFVTLPSKMISLSEAQPTNSLFSIAVTPAGIVRLTREVQFLNAP